VKTGAIKYEGARVPIPRRFYASPVAFEDKLLLTNVNGESFAVKAGPQRSCPVSYVTNSFFRLV
jgi:hypothetical protein